MPIKMNINRLKMLAAMEAKLKQLEAEHKEYLKRWEVKAKEELVKHVSWLEKELKLAKSGDADKLDNYIRHTIPSKPADNKRIPQLKGLIERLKLAEDEVLSVDDKSDYFEFVG